MSNQILLSKYGFVISDKEIGDNILKEISSLLNKSKNVEIDFKDIKSMATFCSKQIFGSLYLKLTPEHFYEKLTFKNVNDDVKLLLKIGIQNAIEDSEKSHV